MPSSTHATHTGAHRAYRASCHPGPGEVSFRVAVDETDLYVTAQEDLSREIADFVRELRGRIKAYILCHPEFQTSLSPLEVPVGAPEIVRAMAEAAGACGVGPMAAVAGAVAQRVAEAFQERSPDILVENGGDIYLCSTKPRTVGLLPDPTQDAMLGVTLAPEDFPLSLCSSSGRIGHSLSLGQGDLAVVLATSGATADAAATALCNMLRSKGDADQMMNRVVGRAREMADRGLGVVGLFAQAHGRLTVWGRVELTVL
jgi:uncharacterized protein